MGVNQFTVYTQQEFAQRFLGLGQMPVSRTIENREDNVEAVIVDWVERGAVGPVKNQGLCGGAALYSTLGGVEALNQILSGDFESFSEQQLIDCAFGCTGAQPTQGYNYYKNHSRDLK
jgi:C1A family cysteine protease